MNELEIIHLALDNLPKDLAIRGEWKGTAPDKAIDGEVLLTIDNHPINYKVEVKKELRAHQLNQIFELNQKYQPFLMVAGHLFPKIKEELRAHDVAYLEANGNLFLKHNGSILFIENNKPLAIQKETGNRAFTKTGLKVVFELLRDETWIHQTYQVIADHTGTTVGNIHKIMTGLKEDGFLVAVTKNENQLDNKKELLARWMTAYEEKLQPNLRIGTFRFLKKDDFLRWKQLPLQPGKTLWGGEPAGDLLTNYLQPEELTLYTNETRNELLKHYQLVPDEKGNIKVYQKFWRKDDTAVPTVPPLLVYADLMNTHDRRNRETAQKVYDAYLQNKI